MDTLALLNAIRSNHATTTSIRVPTAVVPQSLASALQRNTVATQLVLAGNDHYSLGEFCLVLEAISNNESLKVLDVSRMDLDSAFVHHVADFVRYSTALVRLDVSCSDIDEEAAAALGAAVDGHPTLHTLVVNDCNLGDEGIAALLRAMPRCNLYKIDVGHNGLTAAAAQDICEFAHKVDNLMCVISHGNHMPSHLTQRMNARFLSNATLLGVDAGNMSRPQSQQQAKRAAAQKAAAAPRRGSGQPIAAPAAGGMFPSLQFLMASDGGAGPGMFPTVASLTAVQ
jgi:hypothetical protein